MFDLLSQILDHTFSGSGGERIIAYGCICLVCLLTIWILDRISVFIISLSKGGK